MSQHKLPLGKALIDGIVELGKILGYHIEKEFPVDKVKYGEPPAVDIAWFATKNNKFPLFIFEVESKSTNSMSKNPLKVFSKESKELEKPLFFFHIVAKGGQYSSNRKDLEAQFGKNNYKIYLFSENNGTTLIQDIIGQHARIKCDIDYLALNEVLNSTIWKDKTNYKDILNYASDIQLSQNDILFSYSLLSIKDKNIFPDLMQLIKIESENNFNNGNNFNTYLGSHWLIPVFYAIIIGSTSDKEEIKYFSDKLLIWQNKSSYMSQITPAFGLSIDYDEFIIGLSPQFITLCIATANMQGEFCKELVLVLIEIMNDKIIKHHWFGINSATYLLHLSARLNMKDEFLIAKKYLNQFENLSLDDILNPISFISIFDSEFSDYYQESSNLIIPNIDEFYNTAKKQYSNNMTIYLPALKALTDDHYVHNWANEILTILWSENCKQNIVANK
jgi:hypothetical protein